MQAKLEELEKYNFDPDTKDDEYLVVEGHKGEVGMDVYGLKGRGNNLRQTYSAMVSSLDLWIGKILSSLKTKGIEDNTIVWFLSDNGGINKFGGNNSPLRGGKHTQWEGESELFQLLSGLVGLRPEVNPTNLLHTLTYFQPYKILLA